MADSKQEKKSSGGGGERLKISAAGGSGTGVLLVGCALIAAGIGAAFVAKTARSFSNRGKDRRNCRKDDADLVPSDPLGEITVDCLVGVQENNSEESEIEQPFNGVINGFEVKPNFEGLEIMAKFEQDVKIPSIKFHEDNKESSNEGKEEKREEGLEGTGDFLCNGYIWKGLDIPHTNRMEGESCSDSSVSSQRDTLTESEESEENQRDTLTESMSELNKGDKMSTDERKQPKEISGKTEMIVNSSDNHSIVYQSSLPTTDCMQQKKQVFADGLKDIQKTSNNSEIAIESLDRHKTYKNPEVAKETRERQFIDNMEDSSDLVQERSFQFSKTLQDETNQNRDELVIANIEEEQASKEREREAPVKREAMRTEGSKRTGDSSNASVIHPADLIGQVKVSEPVNAIKEEEKEEEGSPIKFKEQEREAAVEEEHVRVERRPEGAGNTSTESNNDAVHPTESIDQLQVPDLVNATEEEASPIKSKEQEREAPVVEKHVSVQEGSEATGNTFEESNDDAIYPAELIDQLKVSESDANKEEEEEGKEGSFIKPKEQEREAPVEEFEHVIIEEGMEGSTNSFLEPDDDVVHPVELVDLMNDSESVNVNIKEEEKDEEEGSPMKSEVQEREALVEEEHVIVEEVPEGTEFSSMECSSKAIHPAEASYQVKVVSVLVNVNNKEEDYNNKGSPIKSKEEEREASVEEEHVIVEEGSERTEYYSFMESSNKVTHRAELTDQVNVLESINVKDGKERGAPVDKEHARVQEGSEGTTNSSMESNEDQVKVSESVNVSKKEEEESSPIKSKEQEREAPDNEEHDQVVRSKETGNSCEEPKEVEVLELVNYTSPKLEITEKFEDMVAPAETEYGDKTSSELENHLPCTNLEQGEFSVDSSATIQERTCDDAEMVIETFETQNADVKEDNVIEEVGDRVEPFIEEVGDRVEGSEVIGDSSMVLIKEAISPIKTAKQKIEFDPLSESKEIEQADDMVSLAQAEEHKEHKVPRKVAEAVVVERGRRLNGHLTSSYRVFILVLLALGVTLGLLAFAYTDDHPKIYHQLSQLLFSSDRNAVSEL